MTIFPLYDQLFQTTLSKHDKKFINTDFIIEEIGKLEPEQHEIIYVLMKMYQLNTMNNNTYSLPIGCKKLKKGLKVDIELLPNSLLYIIEEFINIHIKST